MSINLLIWNARGVANKSTQSTIKFLIKTHKISIMAIIEPLTAPKPDFFSRMFGLDFKGVNDNGQICLFIESGMETDEWNISEQVLYARISSELTMCLFICQWSTGNVGGKGDFLCGTS